MRHIYVPTQNVYYIFHINTHFFSKKCPEFISCRIFMKLLLLNSDMQFVLAIFQYLYDS